MTIVRRLLPAALLVFVGADALKAQAPAAGQLQNAWTNPCTLSVVLVTFRDTTARHPRVTDALGNVTVRADTFDYHLHDRPHGYTVNRTTGALEPGTSSYTMDDWERMFSGGYRYSENGETGVDIPAFTGTQIVADNDDGVSETLPEVFGSLRHYFHEISGGDETSDPDFELRVRILNEEDRNGYPIWVELPHTKGYYAQRAMRTLWNSDYWKHARNATLDSVRAWDLDSTAYDPPGVGSSLARRLRHKVLYLYAGAQFNDPAHPLIQSQIHPQADYRTSANPTIRQFVGFRYVAAERQGSGKDAHEADRWGGIGIHAHEIGHLLGFSHPDGRWDGTEVYTRRTATCANGLSFGQGGRMAGWGTMNSGIDGPVVEGRQTNSKNSYKYAFASCPNPYNPIYLRDLNWGTWETITASQENKLIQPGRYYFIEGADGSEIAVEFRTAEGFGRYTGWYRFDQAPGLMIWKRSAGADQDEPRLVPADNRSVYNATMGCPPQPNTNHPPCNPATGFTGTITAGLTPRSFSSSAVYPWIDRISDPFGALEGNGMRSTFLPLPTHANGTGLPATPTLARPDLRPVGTQAADDSHLRRNSFRCPNNDDTSSHLAFRNIRVTRNASDLATGSALVDIYFDHWVGSISGMETWAGPDTVYVGGDVTIESGASLTIANNTPVRFLAPVGADANGRPELIVASGGRLSLGSGVTFGTVDRDGARTGMYGLRVETGGTATLNGVTLPEGAQRWSGQTGPAALRLATFGSSSYTLIEGGQPVEAGPIGLAEDPSQAYRQARVTVQLTPAPSAAVRIPVAVASGSSGYDDDLDAAGLLFPASRTSASFVVRAVRDADTEDESIGLSFGTLPAGVVAGAPSASTVTIYDTPNQPTGLTATPGHGRMTLRWTDPKHSGIAGWQYWAQPVGTARDTWVTIEGSGASTTEATVPNLTDGKQYNFRVRAYTRGYGVASEMVKATPTGLQAMAYNGAVGLAWVDPGTEGLAGWQTRHQPLPSGDFSEYTVHADGVGTHVVRGLSNDTEYRFEVQGLNAAGEVLDPCPWKMTHPCTWQAVATPKASLSWPPNVAGEVSLSSTSPQVNAAVTATLSDLDEGVRDTTWQWQRRRAVTEQWTAVDEATSSSHAPQTGDLGYMLRATVDYTDRHGPGQRAESEATAAVAVGPPGVPQRFKAVAGDRQVLLTWAAPASMGGSPLRGYYYREIVAGDTTAWFDFLTDWTRYLRRELSNGVAHTFEVRAFNRSGAGASVDTTVTPAGAPRAPGGFTAVPGDGQVALRWTAADSNGAPITAYEVRHAPKSRPGAEVDWTEVDWTEVPGDSTARDTTITGLSNGTTYVFQAAARNRVGLGTPAEKEAAPQGLVITAPDTVWFAENRTDPVAPLSTDPADDAVTWSRAGADAALFEVRGETLYFETAPDFEAPGDADEDNFYEVTLTATDDGEPAASASHDMTVAVTNAPEAGTVTLSTTQPRVGMHLTATLTDPDQGVTNDRWSWEELGGASSAGQRTRASAQSQRYTVEDRVKGRRLVAKVTYTDGHGPDQAVSDTTAAVRANVPGAPGSLQATAGDGRVTLRWTSADSNGAWITGYAYRDSAHTAGSTWSAWPETPPIAADATSHAVAGLDNGTGYTFEVRAVNPVGAGPASSPASATPRGADSECVITVSEVSKTDVPENTTPTVGVYEASANSLCGALTWSRTGSDASSFQELRAVTGQPNQRSLHFVSAPNYEAKRIYSVTIRVSDPSGRAGTFPRSVTVTDVNEAPSITGAGRPTIDENSRPVGTYTASDPDAGDVITWLSLGGVEASLFQLSDLSPAQTLKRELSFRSAPDFERRGSTYDVQVRVRDQAGLPASLRVTVSVRNIDEPGSVTFDKSTIRVGDSVTATLTDPDGGMTNDRWTWTAVAPGASGQDEHDPISESRTAKAPEIGYRLRAAVTYDDRQGTGKSAQALTSVIQIPVNRAPVLTGASTVTRDENGPSPWTVTTYSATDPDNPTTLYFTHRGDQASYFQLTGSGHSRTLEFKSQPDYETRHTYKVRVIVSDKSTGGLKDSVSTTVTLNDIDDPGKVVITHTAPRVGQRITAKLHDQDGGVTNDLWYWVPLSSGASGTQGLRPDATSPAYTIKAKDVGKVLEATVEYDDGDGPGKSAYTRSNTVSASPPGAPKSFTASRGDGEVYLSWGEADHNGSDITHYETRHKEQTASSWSGWSQAAKGAKARADTFSSLTNGTAYSFEVRAENGKGEGPSASDSATPAGLPGAPKSLATARPGPGQASISWEAADANGSDITRYQYRRRVGTTGRWRGWFTVTGGGGARSRTVSGLSDATAYTWEVRCENGEGFGPAASIYQPPAGPGGNVGQGPDSEGDNLGDNEGEPDTPMEDESDDTATAKPVAGGLAGPAALHVTTAPNPFNSSTTLFLHLPTAGPVTLTVYNTAGQVVAELRGEVLEAGRHQREWHGTDERGRPAASGLYLYRLIAGGQVRVGKIALIR